MDQAHYETCLANGCSERLAEMLASGRPPRAKTDDTFFRGWSKVGGASFDNPLVREMYMAEAKAAGVDVTGKQYLSQIAAYPGDPRAWVDSRGDITRVLEERGWSCDGDLKVKGRETPDDPGPALAEDIVADKVAERLEADPTAKAEDVREQVIEQHKPRWSK